MQIPEGITKIRNNAFYNCQTVTSIEIPEGVLEIGYDAFALCKNLESITIPNTVTRIGSSAFSECLKLANVSLPNQITKIETFLFSGCVSLSSLTIPKTVNLIEGTAFERCSNLEEISVDSENTKYIVENDILYNRDKTKLVRYSTKKPAGDLQILSSVTCIGEYSCSGCSNLTNVTIPGHITKIETRAFDNCRNLQSVIMAKGVQEVGGSEVFAFCSSLTNVTLPDTITKIGHRIFDSCSELTGITIPKSVVSMGTNPISRCAKLTNVSVDEANGNFCSKDRILYDKKMTKIIGYSAGNKENSFRIPDGVTEIGAYAFEGVFDLKEIMIPTSVIKIGSYAFETNSVLNDIFFDGDEMMWKKAIGTSSQGYRWSEITIHYGSTAPEAADPDFTITNDGILTGYKGTPTNGVVRIPDSVIVIGENAFKDRTDITTVYIPRSVTEIKDGAFHGCTALRDVYYEGTEEEWRQIKIGKDNEPLTNATLHIYYISKPDDIGNISFLPHLYQDCEHKNQLPERGIELFANGGSVKSGNVKVNYKSVSMYTDITASYHYTYNASGKQVTSTGKVVVGITSSNATVPVVTKKNTIEDNTVKDIAAASIKDGKITVTAKTLPGTVYLWVIDTGDAKEDGKEIAVCCPVVVRSAPTKVNLYSYSAESYDTNVKKYTKGEVNVGSSVYLYAFPTYTSGTNTVKAEDATYTAKVDTKAEAFFTVTRMKGNCFAVSAKALDKGKKVSGNIYVTCNQNGKKATFTATAVNGVMAMELKEPSLLETETDSETGMDTVTIELPADKGQKRGTFKLVPVGEDGSNVVTDTKPVLYAMKNADSFKFTSKGAVSVTEKPVGNQTKLTASFAKDKKTVTVTAAKNAVAGTTVYYLAVYHTRDAGGYKVIKIKAE